MISPLKLRQIATTPDHDVYTPDDDVLKVGMEAGQR